MTIKHTNTHTQYLCGFYLSPVAFNDNFVRKNMTNTIGLVHNENCLIAICTVLFDLHSFIRSKSLACYTTNRWSLDI